MAAASFREVVADCSSSDSDDSDNGTSWKRTQRQDRTTQSLSSTKNTVSTITAPQTRTQKPHKKNNIWSNIMQEEMLSEGISHGGLESFDRERGAESYNFEIARQLEKVDSEDDVKGMEVNNDMGVAEKRPIKERLGPKNSPEDEEYDITKIEDRLNPKTKVNRKRRQDGFDDDGFNKRSRGFTVDPDCIDAKPDDPTEKIVCALSNCLDEPKIHLLTKVVEVLGGQKALDLLKETESIEETGGLKIKDNSRRRTAGGVYLYLLRNDQQITRDMKDKIFEEEYDRRKKHFKAVRSEGRRARYTNAKKPKGDVDTRIPSSIEKDHTFEHSSETAKEEAMDSGDVAVVKLPARIAEEDLEEGEID